MKIANLSKVDMKKFIIIQKGKFMDRLKILADCELKRQQKIIGKEVLHKEKRPYLYITLKINNVNWAIPLRSNIGKRPKITYWQVGSSGGSVEGFDFTKALIVNDNSFCDSAVRISNKKRKYINDNYSNIEANFKSYIGLVQQLKKYGKLNLDPRTKYSTIKKLI